MYYIIPMIIYYINIIKYILGYETMLITWIENTTKLECPLELVLGLH